MQTKTNTVPRDYSELPSLIGRTIIAVCKTETITGRLTGVIPNAEFFIRQNVPAPHFCEAVILEQDILELHELTE